MCVYRNRLIHIISIQRIVHLGLLLCKTSSFLLSLHNFFNSDCCVFFGAEKVFLQFISLNNTAEMKLKHARRLSIACFWLLR